MFDRKIVLALGLLAAASRTAFAVSLTEDFSSNPFAPAGNWSFGVGSTEPSTNRIIWNSTAPVAYTGDPLGALDVHLDSGLPTVRLQRPLGVTLTDTNDFSLTARFSFVITSAPPDQAMQMAFGLVNSTLTGSNRTGTAGVYDDDDTFHTVEFNYFPNSGAGGPTLTPTVLGGQKPGLDAFGNIAFVALNLGDNTNGVTNLPQNVTLEAVLDYTASNKTFSLTMSQVNSNGTLTLLATELPPLNLFGGDHVYTTYDTNFPFVVDTLAIMAYQDGYTTTDDPSLVADLRFQKLGFVTTAPAPQPPSYVSIDITGTNVVLTFPTVSNSIYYVQTRTNLTFGSWSVIASNITGTGGIATNVHVGAATVPARFYRVGLAAP